MRTGYHPPSADAENSKGIVDTIFTLRLVVGCSVVLAQDARIVSLRTRGAVDVVNPSSAGVFPVLIGEKDRMRWSGKPTSAYLGVMTGGHWSPP